MTTRRRFATYNYDQGSRLVQPAPATQDIPTEATRRNQDAQIRLREQSEARLDASRGSGQSLLLAQTVEGPFNNPADTTPTRTVLTFTVPAARVLTVNGIGWKLSDPFLQSSVSIYNVEINVNGGAVPFWQDADEATPIGAMPNIIAIDPIYLPECSVLSVLLRRVNTGFVEFIAVAVFVRGWLDRTVGGL